MPLYGLLIIFTAPTIFWYIPLRAKEILFVTILVNNVLIPAALMPFFRFRNLISSWYIDKREERTIPLMTITILYAITSFILTKLQIPVFFKAYIYSMTLLSLILLAVNMRMKISAYSTGAGALVSVVLALSLRMSVALPLYLAGSVLISGVIISSRLRLNAHDDREVYYGFLIGLAVPVSIMLLFR